MHAVEVATGHRQVTRMLRAASQHHRVELLCQLVGSKGLRRIVRHALRQGHLLTITPVLNLTPSASIWAMRQSISRLSSLKSGMP